MDPLDNKRRILAAADLILQTSPPRQKLEALRALVRNINPKLDRTLETCSMALSRLEKLQRGELVELSVESLPENTEEEKKRKKSLLLPIGVWQQWQKGEFIESSAQLLPENTEEEKKRKRTLLWFLKSWKDLQSEINRVQDLLQNQPNDLSSKSPHDKVTTFGKIIGAAKGPFGAVTLAAVAIAAGLLFLQAQAVEITITNQGCHTIHPTVATPISLPGLSLPSQPIPDGGRAVVVVPPLTFAIDGRQKGQLLLRAYGLTLNFNFSEGIDISLNGKSLVGERTSVNLAAQKQHQLLVHCK